MIRILRAEVVFFLAVVLLAGLCFGQTQTARLQGVVHDASGASVPNAKVFAINEQTRDVSEATSNADGLHVLPALRPGTYTLTVEAAGFSKTAIRDIELAVSASIAQDVTLELGKLNYTGTRGIGSVQRQVANYDGVYFFDPNTYFNNFAYPGMADYGNAGRNTFLGPPFFNVDASLVKSSAITEHKRLVFRAEAYNLLNNVNFANPSFSLVNPQSFGKISGVVSNPRLLQGALRFEW
jgi:hypothetical protein